MEGGVRTTKSGLKNTHEEADLTLIYFTKLAYEEGQRVIQVLSDDTDVFVMLVSFYKEHFSEANVYMTSLGIDSEF